MKIKDILEQITDGKIKSDISLQRDVVYDNKKMEKVIDSILIDVPLPAFYFWKNENDEYEVLDGKQRLEALKKFKNNALSYNGKLWNETDGSIQDKINTTELKIIISEGNEELKREIFYRINTLGVPLNDFEVVNGLYHGKYIKTLTNFVREDKKVSKILGPNNRGKHQYTILKAVSGKSNRMDILDFVNKNKDKDFQEDWNKINKEIKFIYDVFTKYRDLNILWKLAKNNLKDKTIWENKKEDINKWIQIYSKSDSYKLDINKYNTFEKGIIAIVNGITVDNQRLFSTTQKNEIIERDGDNCKGCKESLSIDEATVDHITSWSKGGKTLISNGQILCKSCNSKKGNK